MFSLVLCDNGIPIRLPIRLKVYNIMSEHSKVVG